MSNWQERERQIEENMKTSEEERMGVERNRVEELKARQIEETRKKADMLELLGVASELGGLNEQVWGNLGEVFSNPDRTLIRLVCNYNTYSAEYSEKTERKFGFYTTYLWEGGPQLSGDYAPPGPKQTHLGWHDETRHEFAGWKTQKQSTSLSVQCDYSLETNFYELSVFDSSMGIPLSYFSEYRANRFTLERWDRPVEALLERKVGYWDSYDNTKRSENGYILWSGTSSLAGAYLLFPGDAFDLLRVRGFLLTAFSVSCIQRRNAKLLPADLIRVAEEERRK